MLIPYPSFGATVSTVLVMVNSGDSKDARLDNTVGTSSCSTKLIRHVPKTSHFHMFPSHTDPCHQLEPQLIHEVDVDFNVLAEV